MRLVILIFAFICIPVAAFSATIKIPADYPTIQQGIDAAFHRDVVLVDPGTYLECIDFKGKAITVKSFAGAKKTIIKANQAASVVMFKNDETPISVLQGFTITGGTGVVSPYGGRHGGGICCNDASPTIMENLIIQNHCYSDKHSAFGGGISLYYSSALVINNEIRDNSVLATEVGGFGGGVHVTFGAPVLKWNRIIHNFANAGGVCTRGGGGGICINSHGAKALGNLIKKNSARGWRAYGGGIMCLYKTLIANNLVCENSAIGVLADVTYPPPPPIPRALGGGIYTQGGYVKVVFNTFYKNFTTGTDESVYINFQDTISHCIIWNNSGFRQVNASNISYCNVEGGYPGVGNIDADPLFLDPQNYDFHLQHQSPCRNAGDSTAVGLPGADWEGDPRTSDSAPDMGADEFHTHLYVNGDTSPGGTINIMTVDEPNTFPVVLAMSYETYNRPTKTIFGDLYLKRPLDLMLVIGSTGSNGYLSKAIRIPASAPAPLDVPLQVLSFDAFTNLFVLKIR